MKRLITLALLFSISESACKHYAKCEIWEYRGNEKVCILDPYTDPEAHAACESRAQTAEPCPVFDSQNRCEIYLDTYDRCMLEAAKIPGSIR